MYAIDRNQGESQSGYDFGYIFINDGGIFFTWNYTPDDSYRDQVKQVIQTMEEDTTDPPAGRWSWDVAEQSLRSHIARYGLLSLPLVTPPKS